MFVTRVGLAISAAFLVAGCSNQANVKTYSVAESREPAVPSARLSRTGTDYRPAVRVAARRERSMIDVERPVVGGLSPSVSQPITVRESAGAKMEQSVQAPITPVSHATTRDPQSQRVVQQSNFLEGLAKDDIENQLLKRKTTICRGC